VLQVVLDHAQHDRWQVEHLPRLERDHRRLGQRSATPGVRRMHHRLIGVLDLAQRLARTPRLPTRPAVGALPPRLPRRLLITLSGRRLVRVPRVLAQPGTQLRVLGTQGLDHRSLLGNQHAELGGEGGVGRGLIGTLILVELTNGMFIIGLGPATQQIVQGFVVIAAVLLCLRSTPDRGCEVVSG